MTETTDPRAMACHILDHGWELVDSLNMGKLDHVQLYKTWQRPFLTGVDLETAYAMQKAQEDSIGDKCPLQEAKNFVAKMNT